MNSSIDDSVFGRLEWDGECWRCEYVIFSTPLTIEITDFLGPERKDNQTEIEAAKTLLLKIDEKVVNELRLHAAKELIVDSHSQLDSEPTPSEIASLENSMILKSVVFSDDAALFIWTSSILEHKHISLQTNEYLQPFD